MLIIRQAIWTRFPPKVRAEAGVVAPARLILRHQNSGE